MKLNEKNNRSEAEVLISYAKMECNNAKIILPMLDALLTNKPYKWDWRILEIIEERTSYIFIDNDGDIDVEIGDWGIPVMMGGGSRYPVIEDKGNLMFLRQEVDDILNHTTDKISKFLSLDRKPKWKCQCGRFLGKELSSIEEIKKLLRDFSIGKYWKCRSCKMLNYFIFEGSNIVFKNMPPPLEVASVASHDDLNDPTLD
jgi:hypothetical protein